MAVETTLPAPTTIWDQVLVFPGLGINITADATGLVGNEVLPMRYQTGAGATQQIDYRVVDAGGSQAYNGYLFGQGILAGACRQNTGVAADTMQGWIDPGTQVAIAPAAGFAAGYGNPEIGRIMWIRCNLLLPGPALFTGDGGGFYLYAYPGNAGTPANLPTGAANRCLCGIVGRDIGGGVQGYRYTSWVDAAGTQGETVNLDDAVLGTLWNTMDFIVTSAAGGREPSLRVVVNGTILLTRDFGTANLVLPSVLDAAAYNLGWVIAATDQVVNSPILFRWRVAFGGFTPDGAPVSE